LLTENGEESGKMYNVKVIDNFETFPESINMSSSDQQFKSYDHCKLGVLLEINSGQIKLSGQIWTLSPLPKELWGNFEYQNSREFLKFSNDG
jgi:hypothetical protein